MHKRSLITAIALLAIFPAAASAAGDNVVVIAVGKVDVPARLPGLCEVRGTVTEVEDGNAFHAGQAISLKVPCRGNEAVFIPAVATLGGPTEPRFISADILRKSYQGLARIDDAGTLIWDYTKRTYGPWGLAGGYRVMDGIAVPAFP